MTNYKKNNDIEKMIKKLQEEIEALKIILGVKKGCEDYQAGKLIAHDVVKDRLKN